VKLQKVEATKAMVRVILSNMSGVWRLSKNLRLWLRLLLKSSAAIII